MSDQMPSRPRGTGFDIAVCEIVRQVPPGRVVTYGQIAAMIPAPAGIDPEQYAAFRARWVGGAIRDCPSDVPWQRVINSQGKISPRGAGSVHQRQLLEAEGVVFDPRGKIDLDRFGWDGPSSDWLAAHGLISK